MIFTDSNNHLVHHHQLKRLRHPYMSLLTKTLYHHSAPGEECQKINHEHGQKAKLSSRHAVNPGKQCYANTSESR